MLSYIKPVPCEYMYIELSAGKRVGQSGDRINFGVEISRTRPCGSPSFLYVGYRLSSHGLKRPGRGVDHPYTSSAEVEERVQLYLYSSYNVNQQMYTFN